MKTLYNIFFFLLMTTTAYGSISNDSLMKVLKIELTKQPIYDRQVIKRINKLKTSLSECSATDLKRQYELSSSLYFEYFNFQYDSAYVYTQRLLSISTKMRDLPKQYESKIKLGLILISSGMFIETSDCLKEINPILLNLDSKLLYYELKYRYYLALSEYNSDKVYSKKNTIESLKYLDTAITLSKPNSFERIIKMAQLPVFNGKVQVTSRKYYEYLLYNMKLTPHQVAMVATGLSAHYTGNEKLRLLLTAAINDIRTSTKETLAIFMLGKELDKRGDVINAYTYLQEAMNNAQFYGSRLHKVEIASVLPYVAAKKLLITENEKNRMLLYLISAFAISVITAMISFIVFIQLKKLRLKEIIIEEKKLQLETVNAKLIEDAHIKEEYIGYFFKIISGNISKLEKVKRTIERKVKVRHFDDLIQFAEEIDIKSERETLFETFDKVFLKLFPDFLKSFNALLKPEEQIWPKGKEALTTKLRIFALMRLGIKDNQTIADILESSISTINTYKIRIKSKALVQGDEFDNHIMKIEFGNI